MKTVHPSSQVAHLFANQSQEHARNSNNSFFFHGRIAYSWRMSWPAAVVTPWKLPDGRGVVLFRNDSPSMSTGRHLGKLRRAFDGLPFESFTFGDSMRDSEAASLAASAAHGGDECPNLAREARAAIVAEYIKRATDRAESVYALRSADRIAWNLGDAAETLARARMLASVAKGNERAHLVALIAKAERDIPADILAAASAHRELRAKFWRMSYAGDEYVTTQKELDAQAARLADLVTAERRRRVAASRLAAIAKARKDARTWEKRARGSEDVRAKRDALRDAAAYHRKARDLAKRAKLGAAIYRKDDARAERCALAAARLAPRCALAEGAALADTLARNARELRAILARGRRVTVRRMRTLYAAGELRYMPANPGGVPDAWQSRREKIASACTLAETVRNVASMADARAHVPQRGASWYETALNVAELRDLAARGDKRAAHLVRDILAGALAMLETAPRLRDIINKRESVTDGRRVAASWEEMQERAPLSVETARNYADAAGNVRAWRARLVNEFGEHVAARIMPADVASLAALKTRAEALAAVAAKLRTSRGTHAASAGDIATQDVGARCELNAGRAFAAHESAARNVAAWDNALKTRNAQAEAARDALADVTLNGFPEVAEAWRDVLATAEREAGALESLRETLADTLTEARNARNAACADIIGHWRRTGEAGREFWDATRNAGAIFRRNNRGEIESSQGATVSESAGRRLWALIRACVAANRGRTWEHGAGPHVGSFTVREIRADGSAVVGCHSISARESRAFAEFMQWPPFGAATEADALADGDA